MLHGRIIYLNTTGAKEQSCPISFFNIGLYLGCMKLHLTAIAFNEKELETYVLQLKNQQFESVSEVKKADDGSYYQVMARTAKESWAPPKTAPVPVDAIAG